ncbi:hypothetical protein ACIPEL_20555 [Streptomyces griseoviridis]
MTRHEEVLDSIRRDSDLAEVLWRLCEFDLSRSDPGEPVRLSSGVALEGIAGDYTGGTFFLCGNGKIRPVLYASSEGQAGLIGNSLTEALEIVVGLPSWWDCLKFSGAGDLAVMRATADHLRGDELRDEPGKDADRATVAQALGLGSAPVSPLLGRLHAAVSATVPDFVLTSGATEYESLFGPWLPSRNPAWQ